MGDRRGVLKDEAEAVRWFRLAAERVHQSVAITDEGLSDAELENLIAEMERSGPRQGHASAQFNLGVMSAPADPAPGGAGRLPWRGAPPAPAPAAQGQRRPWFQRLDQRTSPLDRRAALTDSKKPCGTTNKYKYIY